MSKWRPLSKWRMSRRKLLRGAGGVALALPFLDVMEQATAQTEPAVSRFVTWFRPGGCVVENWFPTGGETDFVLGKTLASLERHRQNLLIFSGLDYKTEGSSGHPHYQAFAAWLTANILKPGRLSPAYGAGGNPTTFAHGPSLDSVIADQIRGGTKLRTLDLNVRDDGPRGPNPSQVCLYDGPEQPRAPIVNPAEAWDTLFADLEAPEGVDLERIRLHRRSVLDAVLEEYRAVSTKVSASDRATLDAHATRIRDIENQLIGLSGPADGALSGSCAPPEKLELVTVDPNAEEAHKTGSTGGNGYTSAKIPELGRALTDIMLMALACDLVRVANFQWLDPVGFYGLDFMALGESHHFYQHNGGYRPDELTILETWYMEQFAFLLDQMTSIRDAADGSSLLDTTLIYSGSELSRCDNHTLENIPFILAGNLNGQVRTGRYLTYGGRSHTDLLVAIQNLYGIDSPTFGRPDHTPSALTDLG